MEDQYGMADLRQVMINGGKPHFLPINIPHHEHDLFSSQRNLMSTPVPEQPHYNHHHYDLTMMTGRLVSDHMIPRGPPDHFPSDSTTVSAAPTVCGGFEMEAGFVGGDGGNGRWPREETLMLLEIRSRLDSRFKEANQKGPLWDEVSRIMSEEHGYQRTGRKCREKFENLYKYYKKTKEGKAGRQDGKHYRFFRQLEALYGETSNSQLSLPETHFIENSSNLQFNFPINSTTPSDHANQDQAYNQYNCQKHPDYDHSLSLSNTSDQSNTNFSSDGDNSGEKRRKRRGRKSWKAKIMEFIDSQMRKLVEKQEAWLEKVMKTLEQKEKERILRDTEWRKQETSRIEREHIFWEKERAWIEARDAALMDALQKLTGSTAVDNSNIKEKNVWSEDEITKLIQIRNGEHSSFPCEEEEILWEDIAVKMACLGYEKDALMCKEKWENMVRKSNECNKKLRKENPKNSSNYYNNQNEGCLYRSQTGVIIERGSNVVNDSSCFRLLMGDQGDQTNLWENYGLKLNNGDPINNVDRDELR